MFWEHEKGMARVTWAWRLNDMFLDKEVVVLGSYFHLPPPTHPSIHLAMALTLFVPNEPSLLGVTISQYLESSVGHPLGQI